MVMPDTTWEPAIVDATHVFRDELGRLLVPHNGSWLLRLDLDTTVRLYTGDLEEAKIRADWTPAEWKAWRAENAVCRARVSTGSYINPTRKCEKPGKVEIDTPKGTVWYCGMHDPEKRAKTHAKRQERWHAEGRRDAAVCGLIDAALAWDGTETTSGRLRAAQTEYRDAQAALRAATPGGTP